jgi:ribonuclease HII
MRTLENALRRWGFYRVAGCDEVGRGCLAGPVVAGAVILDPARHIPGLSDSKTITAAERERLCSSRRGRSRGRSLPPTSPKSTS